MKQEGQMTGGGKGLDSEVWVELYREPRQQTERQHPKSLSHDSRSEDVLLCTLSQREMRTARQYNEFVKWATVTSWSRSGNHESLTQAYRIAKSLSSCGAAVTPSTRPRRHAAHAPDYPGSHCPTSIKYSWATEILYISEMWARRDVPEKVNWDIRIIILKLKA
jgi:hypothetical protein